MKSVSRHNLISSKDCDPDLANGKLDFVYDISSHYILLFTEFNTIYLRILLSNWEDISNKKNLEINSHE